MNIGFYDPISERWIKPRPEKEPDPAPTVSMGEALLNAVAAAALKERNDKIWEYLKQTAEGCNAAPVTAKPDTSAADNTVIWFSQTIEFLAIDAAGIKEAIQSAPSIVVDVPPEYEAVESLGYIYWKPKVTI